MLKLKVCGMRDEDNLHQLLRLKPDFVGFIFYKNSSRHVTQPLPLPKPDMVNYVGVFVDDSIESIQSHIKTYQLDYVQLHGKESPEFCAQVAKLGVKIIKAFNINAHTDFKALEVYTPSCDFFLFDASGKLPGGNGISFNWELLKQYKGSLPFFLSGGIQLSMAWKIKYLHHPKLYAIDINSQFEYKPALKNINDITIFKDELQH